jgi:protease-4
MQRSLNMTESSAAADVSGEQGVLLAFMREMTEQRREAREQRLALEKAHEEARKERTSEHRWRIIFQLLIFGVPALMAVAYFLFFLFSAGFRLGPFGNVVGVVRIAGPIAAEEAASADKVIPALEKAFSSSNVKGVVLSIDSPGGAPVEAERIYTAIEQLKTKHKKPVVAVINNLGASAGYMIAVHADKVIAGKYSIVGSIGAIMDQMNYEGVLRKVDVKHRVFASGPMKNFLNPFSPPDPAVDAKAQELVNQLAKAFEGEVRNKRGARLKDGIDIATGEVWTGQQAKEIGLVDHVGTIEEYVEANLGGLALHNFGPERSQSLASVLRGAFSGSWSAPTGGFGEAIPSVR